MTNYQTKIIAAALCAVGIGFGAGSAAAQQDGQVAFNNACRTCHTVKEGDNRLGPSLHGVVGREAGSVEGFGYSDSMKQSGITWDEAQLDKFIANPDAVVPGNNMKPFGGIADAGERKQIVSFLKQSSE